MPNPGWDLGSASCSSLGAGKPFGAHRLLTAAAQGQAQDAKPRALSPSNATRDVVIQIFPRGDSSK